MHQNIGCYTWNTGHFARHSDMCSDKILPYIRSYVDSILTCGNLVIKQSQKTEDFCVVDNAT